MKLIIDESIADERIDLYLAEIMPDYSRTKIQNCIKKGDIRVNALQVKPSYTLKLGDLLEVNINVFEEEKLIKPEEIPLQVVWEDENMAVLNKPSGLLTHPTTIETSNTLVNALLFRYGDNLSDINGAFRRGIVHRLDRNTSGLIMIAKNNETHEFLVDEMKNKHFVKKYIAIVKGVIEKNEFAINSPIGRHKTIPYKQCVCDDGKESLTLVKVLNRYKDATLVELTLVTGRTHQIRVHMSSIGHPVYNDTLYGFGKVKIKTEEQVLQSYKLEFTKPFSLERISLEIDPDEKFTKVIKALQ